MESLTVFISAAIGIGVVYFIGRKISIPARLDGIVSVVVFTAVLAAVSGALGTTFEEPAPAYAGLPDDACAPGRQRGIFEMEGLPCVTVLQARMEDLTRANPIEDLEDRLNRIFKTLPVPLLVIAYLLGLGGAEYIHKQTST